MAYPSFEEIRQAIISELRSIGGEARTEVLFPRITARFPQLTQQELSRTDPSGQNTWHHRLHSARVALVRSRPTLLDPRAPKGMWRLPGTQLLSPPPPPPSAPSQPVTPDIGLHEQMQAKLEEIGRILGKFAQKEFHARPFTYDTVWKATAQLPPSHVFEVQDKGNLDSALVKLKHASDNWPCQLFLVVTGEKDREKAQELLAEHFAGAFHEIANKTTILSPEDIEALYKVLSQYKDIIGKWR